MSTTTSNPSFVQAYQNFQLPPDSFWTAPPTQANLLQDIPPSIASLNPSLYYPSGDMSSQNTMATYTDPTSKQTVSMAPWPINPAYQQGGAAGDLSSLIVSPAIPSFGGTSATGSYTDPGSAGAPGTDFSYNINDRTATPTEQSLDITLKNMEEHQIPGWGSMLMGLPLELTAAVLGPEVGGAALSALGAAGASAAGAGGTLLGGATSGLGSLVGSGSQLGSLLSDAASAYKTISPAITVAQDALKFGQALSGGGSASSNQQAAQNAVNAQVSSLLRSGVR